MILRQMELLSNRPFVYRMLVGGKLVNPTTCIPHIGQR